MTVSLPYKLEVSCPKCEASQQPVLSYELKILTKTTRKKRSTVADMMKNITQSKLESNLHDCHMFLKFAYGPFICWLYKFSVVYNQYI